MPDALVKLQRKGQMVIPRSLRELAGVGEGTLMKIAVIEGGQFLLTPQFTIDRSVVTGKKDPKQAFRNLAEIVSELRQEAKSKGLDSISREEINRAVTSARRDLKKQPAKHPAK
jgi:AbrB family looped-hinge helix DNA binding protein